MTHRYVFHTSPWTCHVLILGVDNLTPWSLVRLENLTAGLLVKKSSALYGPIVVPIRSVRNSLHPILEDPL
jgi:hypothetical protein